MRIQGKAKVLLLKSKKLVIKLMTNPSGFVLKRVFVAAQKLIQKPNLHRHFSAGLVSVVIIVTLLQIFSPASQVQQIKAATESITWTTKDHFENNGVGGYAGSSTRSSGLIVNGDNDADDVNDSDSIDLRSALGVAQTYSPTGYYSQDVTSGSNRNDGYMAVVANTNHFYVGGYDSVVAAGNEQWRIEKRAFSNGALDTSFDSDGIIQSNLSSGSDRITSMTIDGDFLYVSGNQGLTTIVTEKRSIFSGALDVSFGTGGRITYTVPGQVASIGLVVKNSVVSGGFLYIGTYIYLSSGLGAWHVEKRSIANGAVDSGFGNSGFLTVNPSNNDDVFAGISLVGGDLILAGSDRTVSNNPKWRYEKRQASDGVLVTGFGSGGVFVSDAPGSYEEPKRMVADESYIFAAGSAEGSLKGRIEKVSLANGQLITSRSVSSTPSGYVMSYYNITQQGDYLYAYRNGGLFFGESVLEKINKSDLSVAEVINGAMVGQTSNLYFHQGRIFSPMEYLVATGNLGCRLSIYFNGYSTGTISNLRIDSGVTQKSSWSKINWTGITDAGSSLKFRTRGSNLDDPTGASITGNAGTGWTHWNEDSGGANYYLSSNADIVTPATRWLEIEATLVSDTGVVAPTLKSITVTSTIPAPDSSSLSQKRQDGSSIDVGSQISGSQVKLAVSGLVGWANSTTLKAQFEIKELSPANVTFDGVASVESGFVDTGLNAEAVVSGLEDNKVYKWRARVEDQAGRVSPWTNYNSGNAAFTIDQAPPVLNTFDIRGNAADSNAYVNASQDHALMKTVFNTSDNLSTTLQVQFSYSGTDWSVYPESGADDGSSDNVQGNNWEDGSFRTITTGVTDTNFTLSKAWKLTDQTPNKPIYVRVRDLAGNIYNEFNYSDSLDSSSYKDPATTANWNNGRVSLPSAFSVVWTRMVGWDTPNFGSQYGFSTFGDLDGDGDKDALVGESNGLTYAYRNTGTSQSPAWSRQVSWDVGIDVGYRARPVLADLDNDEDQDMLIESESGTVFAVKNTNNKFNPTWSRFAGWEMFEVGGSSPFLSLADLDGDSDLDALVSYVLGSQYLKGYRNTGSVNSPNWIRDDTINPNVSPVARYGYLFFDIDGDSDLDLYKSCNAYENIGSRTVGNWVSRSEWNALTCGSFGGGNLGYSGTDIDADGDVDIFAGGDLSGTSTATLAYQNGSSVQYQTPKIVQSTKLSSTNYPISKSTLIANQNLNGQTISYQLTRDGGVTWENVIPGAEYTFTSNNAVKNDLRWKATMSTANTAVTPEILDVSLGYKSDLMSDTITLDTAPPNAPGDADLAAADDSGSSSSDNVTKNTTGLTFTGTAEAGATVQLYDGVGSVGTPATATGGNWSIDLALAEGAHDINAKCIDPAGNSSTASNNLAVTVDTTVPNATSTAIISGDIASGWNENFIAIANQTNAKLSGNKATDTKEVKLEFDDEDSFSAAPYGVLVNLGAELTFADGGGLDLSGLADGRIAYRLTSYDLAGNTNPQTVLKNDSNIFKDTVSPTGTVSIKGGAQYTNTNLNVPVTVTATDAAPTMGVKEYQLSNNGINFGSAANSSGNINDAGWTNYGTTPTTTWNLIPGDEPGNNEKHVYGSFRDEAGNKSGTWHQTSQADFDQGEKNNVVSVATGAITLGETAATVTLRPSGPGLYTEWSGQSPSSGAHWEKVDEAVVNDDDFVYESLAGPRRDLFDLPGTAIPAEATISSVKIYNRINFDSGGNLSYYQAGFYDGTGAWFGDQRQSTGGDYSLISTTLNVNPRTGSAWTLSEINNLQTGLLVDYGGEAAFQLTQSYAEVSYNLRPSSGTFTSSVKDNLVGQKYGNLFWNSIIPAQAGADALQFRIAAKDVDANWQDSDFVGPAGTTNGSDYYTTSGTPIWAGHADKRFIRYRAYLQTQDAINPPILKDVYLEINTSGNDSITLDTTAPQTPAQVDLNNADDLGLYNADNVTSLRTNLRFSGGSASTEANNKVEIFDNFNMSQTKLGEVTSTGTGQWNFTYSGASLDEGLHQITIVTTDAAENTSAPSTVLDLRIDYTKPTMPGIASIPAGSSDANHYWYQNYVAIANKNSVRVTGSKSAGDIFAGTARISLEFADNDAFTNSITKTLNVDVANPTYESLADIDFATISDGKIAYKVTATDTAGNTETRTVLQAASTLWKDVVVPGGTLTIGGGLSFDNEGYANNANVRLFLATSDATSGLNRMKFSNDGVLWTDWLTYANSFDWDLVNAYGGSGAEGTLKSVYYQLEDRAGNNTADTPMSDDIIYDTVAPSGVTVTAKDSVTQVVIPDSTSTDAWRVFTAPEFAWTASADPSGEGSGVKEFRYCLSTNLSCNPITSKNVDDRTHLADLSALSYGKYYFRVAALDNADNFSPITTFVYAYDRSVPGGVSNFSASSNGGSIRFVWDKIDSHAPVHYIVERIYNSVYVNFNSDLVALGQQPTNEDRQDKVWDDRSGNNTNGYAVRDYPDGSCIVTEGTVTCSDITVEQGRMYNFRIHAYDESSNESGQLQTGPIQAYAITAITTDNTPPLTPYFELNSQTVGAFACSYQNPANCSTASDALKGHEVRLTWNRGDDQGGTGIYRYLVYRSTTSSTVESNYTLIKSIEVVPSDTTTQTYTFYDNSANSDDHLVLSDWTYYYYRVVAQDGPPRNNRSEFAPAEDITKNAASARTADVTKPSTPGSISAAAIGPDESRVKQKVQITWTKANDNNSISNYKLYKATVANPQDGDFTEITNNPSVYCKFRDQNEVIRQEGFNSPVCTESGLDDFTNYYYKVVAIDTSPFLNESFRSATATVRTASSAVPTAVKGPRLQGENDRKEQPYVFATKGNPSSAAVGHQITVRFAGSYAKNCDPVVNTRCLVGYEAYRSEVNYETDEEWKAGATKIYEATPIHIDNDRESDYQFTDNNLNDSTRYFYKILAIDNSPAVPDTGPFATFSNIVVGTLNAGWDITPDVEAPVATADGMAIKVKDTYAKEDAVRNVLTWLVPETPSRNKLSYETCTSLRDAQNNLIIRNGYEQCSDFARYEIWREMDDMQGGPDSVTTLKVHEITDIKTNMFTDEAPKEFEEFKFRYYIVIVDTAGDLFRYEDPNNVAVNPGFSNKTDKIYAIDSIVPAHSSAIISNVTVEGVGVSSATVRWNTDQDTDSLVEFRPMKRDSGGNWQIDDTQEFKAIGRREKLPQHAVYLFGLQPDTKYEYRAVSRNYPFANTTVASTNLPVLKTESFYITYLPNKSKFSTMSADIHWSTNMPSNTSMVEYKISNGGYAGSEAEIPLDLGGKAASELSAATIADLKDHAINLAPLRPSSEYIFKIRAISLDGYVAESTFSSFYTSGSDSSQFTMTPSSSNVADRNITATTAQIVWETAIPTRAVVLYGTEPGARNLSVVDEQMTNKHVIQINGLNPGTKYYYVVKVEDINGFSYQSPEYSFTAILKPKITNMRLSEVTPYTVTIQWDTNVDTETLINWGKTASYGEKKGTQGRSRIHEITVENLEDNTEYHYQILAKDEMGNEVADEDKIVRTPMDKEGPKITDVKTDLLPMGTDDATGSIIISWKTNKPATTRVDYDEGLIGVRLSKATTEDPTLNNSHTVIIRDLNPATTYRFRLVSIDKRGNTTTSNDYNFVTPSKEKSILQLIVKSLEETFAWVKNIGQFFKGLSKKG